MTETAPKEYVSWPKRTQNPAKRKIRYTLLTAMWLVLGTILTWVVVRNPWALWVIPIGIGWTALDWFIDWVSNDD